MDLNFLRSLAQRQADGQAGEVPPGLFGASARQALAAPVAPAGNPNPERSYLGGLIKYQRPEGQTGADRMALLGATLADVGSGLGGGRGGAVSAVQERGLNRQKLAQAERDKQVRARAMGSALDPETGQFSAAAYMRALAEGGVPLDISDIGDARAAQGGHKVISTPDGPFAYDDTTGQGDYVPGPLADQRRQLLEAQIAAARAQSDLRGSQGDYYDARAKQPYAPRAPAKPSATSNLDAIAAELRRRGRLP